MAANPQLAFTAKADGILNVIQTHVHVFQRGNPNKMLPQSFQAIWDTGATCTVITPNVVQKLGLLASGKANIRGVAGNQNNANTYIIDIILPHKVGIQNVRVIEAPAIAGSAEMLIGMDIISLGDFSITNVDRKTVFSFRTPSSEVIDYTKQINEKIGTPIISGMPQSINPQRQPLPEQKKVGENDPCPCGKMDSKGQPIKYKHCHGKAA